jgi:hypothetical protein
VVCRKNPNRKVKWELVTPTASSGTANMMTTSHQQFCATNSTTVFRTTHSAQFSVPPTQQYLPAPFHPQYLTAPNSAPMRPYSRALHFLGLPHLPVLCLVVLLLLVFLALMLW